MNNPSHSNIASNLPEPAVAVQRVAYRQANYQPPLRDKKLLVDEQLCLNAVLHGFGCDMCQTQCPVKAITFDAQGLPSVENACTDCGQCAVVCPTSCFKQPEFTLDDLSGFDTKHSLKIGCQVELKDDVLEANTWQVPCIGGVKTSKILNLIETFPRIEILDKGQCQHCSNTQEIQKKSLINKQAWLYLDALELLEKLTITSVQTSGLVTSNLQPKHTPSTQKITRRGLFQNFLKRTEYKAPDPQQVNPKTIYHTQFRLTPTERVQQVRALAVLTAEVDGSMAQFLPTVAIKSDCCDHQVCRSSCPTGAIFGYQRDGARGLVFDAAQCVSCGLCQQVCPTEQLSFFEQAGSLQPKALTRHERRACFKCGQEFSANQMDESALPICPSCTKDTQLFNSIWN